MFAKIRTIMIIVFFFATSCLSFAYAQGLPDAKEFEDKCWHDGAGAVDYINGITREWDNPVWQGILDKIVSGDEAWIRASACIATNSGYSNQTIKVDIYISWAEALPKNPQAVLGLSAFGIPLGRFCSFPIIEPERAWAAQYVKDTLAALEAIPDGAKMWNIPLDIEKQVCALRLEDAYAKKYDYAD